MNWQYGYLCLGCGKLAPVDVVDVIHAPCRNCGSALGYTRASYRRYGFMGRKVEFSDIGGTNDLFLRLLARELEIEVDGGDDPAAFLGDAIRRARERLHPAAPHLYREIEHSARALSSKESVNG